MPEPIGVKIAGTGRCVGSRVLTNAYFESHIDTTDAWIRERTGIRERRIATEQESTATLAEGAARLAIQDAGISPSQIDLIIIGTTTPEYIFPTTACCVGRALGLNSAAAMDLHATCSGFIYSLITGATMVRSGGFRNALVIGAETMSRITDYEDRTSCILFGDGAGAVVLQQSPDGADAPAILHHHLHADGSGGDLLWVPAGGSKLPPSAMTVNERLHYVKMQGREVFKVAVNKMRQIIDSTLAEAGVRAEDLALIIPHQSNIRIIEATRVRLGLDEKKMYVNIDRFGNTSAGSIPIALDEVRRAGMIKSGDLVLFVAFGAGFTWGSALVRL